VAGGAASSPAGAAGAPAVRDNASDVKDDQTPTAHEPQREERELLHRAETNDRATAGPSEHGPAPVKPPEHQSHRGDEDLGRNL